MVDYRQELQKIKDIRRTSLSNEDYSPGHRNSQKVENKPFILEIVFNNESVFLKGTFKHGKYTTLKRANQALEQLKKSANWLLKYTEEFNIYNINDKNTILISFKIENSK